MKTRENVYQCQNKGRDVSRVIDTRRINKLGQQNYLMCTLYKYLPFGLSLIGVAMFNLEIGVPTAIQCRTQRLLVNSFLLKKFFSPETKFNVKAIVNKTFEIRTLYNTIAIYLNILLLFARSFFVKNKPEIIMLSYFIQLFLLETCFVIH